jgi:serine/threonine protein kinase
MDFTGLVGQTLDEKYQIERELGRGGMGSVYLATHLGTERPVAVKVISPQFMSRPEFIERFRREARAAGRLRHPNVVDVTDFGFALTPQGQVAYLVMEYLDGCTLGEILDEEKNLPLGWTLDILEQVCSAVNEAHREGIIHRDLKPDNIWLEPNQRGGYTVKVLDFGIAKLEETVSSESDDPALTFAELQAPARPTSIDITSDGTIADSVASTYSGDLSTIAINPPAPSTTSEAQTIIQSQAPGTESKTAIITPMPSESDDAVGTRLVSAEVDSKAVRNSGGSLGRTVSDARTTEGLTRVGSVLGTPLYMSPEQCRGEKLDARSDIYSLGVIAYQMLSGHTPFSGEFTEVMEAHKQTPPPTLNTKGVRRKVRQAITLSLAKDPEQRPQSAEAFASELRSQSEGIWILLRRALVIFTEQMPKFLGLTTLLSIPVIIITALMVLMSFLRISGLVEETTGAALTGSAGLIWTALIAFCAYLVTGTVAWIVTQHLAMPLREIKVREVLREARKKSWTFVSTGVLSTFSTFFVGIAAGIAGGIVFGLISLVLYQLGGSASMYVIVTVCLAILSGFVGFLTIHILWTLVAPVVMMENLRGWKALKRSLQLVRRSLATTIGAVFIMFLIPVIFSGITSFVVHTAFKAYTGTPTSLQVTEQESDASNEKAVKPEKNGLSISIGDGQRVKFGDPKADGDMRSRAIATASESLIQILWLPVHIFVTAFTAIIIALLFLKTRQAGGEPMHELLAKFEESDTPRKKWQERVRQRLIQSGRITSRS